MNWRLRCDALHLRRLIFMEPTGAATARRAKAALDRFGVAYNLHDIEHEDGAAEKAIAISGQQHIPVIRFAADGSWLVEPSATQLQAKCKELGLI